jgi:hypothetical protein
MAMSSDDRMASGAVILFSGTAATIFFLLGHFPVLAAVLLGFSIASLIVAGIVWLLWYRNDD